MLVGLGSQLDFGILPRALDVIGNGHTGFELVARRGQHRCARRNYKRSTNQRVALDRSDGVVRNRDRHDFQRAVEIIRHVVSDFALRFVGIDNTRPKHDWFVGDAFERIQLLNVAAAAISRDGPEQREFRNDQIDNLGSVHSKHAFTEIKLERIRRLVIGHLQNSLVDCEDDDLARPICFVTDVQRFARFRSRDCIDVDLEPAFFLVGRERDHAVAERADKNFF